MSQIRFERRLRLRVESPFVSHGLTVAAWGIDIAQCRDAKDRVVLPAELIRGNLRHAFAEIGRDPVPLFGQKETDRGGLILGDLVAQLDQGGKLQFLTRVAIDDATGAAQGGALFSIELARPIGQVVTFEGPLVVFAADETVFDDLRAALERIVAVGAFKTVGFGVVVDWALDLVPDQVASRPLASRPAPRADLGDRVEVTLQFDRPLLVDARRVANNVFQGQAVIPGGVLKGALAARVRRGGWDGLDQALSRMRIGHAFPVGEDGRLSHRPLPLSLVIGEQGGAVRDLLLAPPDAPPPLLNGQAPRFALDWKPAEAGAVRKHLGWPAEVEFNFLTRTRTAIDRETGQSSESQLFSYSALIPGKWCWQAEIERNGADPAAFALLLAVLEEGLDGIGKTDARAAIDLAPADLPPESVRSGTSWAVTLRTPALLNGDPQRLYPNPDLMADYGAYWARAVPGARLVTFFATQRLAGGWQAKKARRTAYYPFLLTEPGAVFLLEGGDPATYAALRRSGLPLPDWLAEATWQTCPFVPENGFGAFDLGVVDHADLLPGGANA